jgi:hypothetical protein
MQALRNGFKRIDNKNNKGKKGKQTPTDLSTDWSDRPILNFQDSNGASPTIPWEPNSLQDDLQPISSEYSPIARNRFKSHRSLYDKSIEPLIGESVTSDSIEYFPGEESSSHLINPVNWQPLSEYDENVPPINNHSISKVSKMSKWKQAVYASESKQPLLVESMTNSSKAMLADRVTPPKNHSRWEPMEHDEGTEPLSGGRPTNNSIGSISSRRTTKFDSQINNISRKQKDQPRRDESLDDTVLKTSKQMMHVSATFDPFESSEFGQVGHENNFQRCNEFGTTIRNLQPFSTETTRINRVQQSNKKHEKFQQPQAIFEGVESQNFRELDQGDIFSSFESVGNRSHLKDRSFLKPECPSGYNFALDSSKEYFEGETCSLQENECSKNDVHYVQTCLKSFTAEKESLTSNAHKSEEPDSCIDSLVVNSTLEFQRDHATYRRETECRKDEIDPAKECLKCCSIEKEQLTSDMNGRNFVNKKDAKDIEDVFDEVSGQKYSPERKANASSVHESNCSRADTELQKKGEQTTDHNAATAFISETVEEDGNQNGLRLVVLLSNFSGTLKQRAEQQRAISILKGRNISNLDEVDGSSLCNKNRRNLLFEISGERGKYPQFFLQKDQNIIIHLGNFEWLEYMNDIGSLTNETIFGASHSTSLRSGSTKIDKVDKTEAEVFNHDPEALNDHSVMNSSFSDRVLAFDIYKNEQSRDDVSSNHRTTNIGKSSCTEEEMSGLDLEANTVAMNSKPGVSSTNTSPIGIESQSITPPNKDIEVNDVESIARSKDFAGVYDSATSFEESECFLANCESESIDNSEYGGLKMQNIYTTTETVLDGGDTGAFTFNEPATRPEQNDNQCIIEEPSAERIREQSDTETISTPFSQLLEKGRRAKLASVGALLDNEAETYGALQFSPRSSCSSIESERKTTSDLNNSHTLTIPPMMNDEEKVDSKRMKADTKTENSKNSVNRKSNPHEIETRQKILSIDIPLRKNQIDTCSDFEKPDLPKVGRDEQKSRDIEAQERRRQRWKRRLLAENLRTQSTDDRKTSSARKREKPIGASLNEIEMINIFLTVLGPDFDGSLSTKELEALHHRSRKAGLTKEFTNSMLDQSAGILMRGKKNEPDLVNRRPSYSVQSLQTKYTVVSPTASANSSSDETYDDHGFTRKTPKAQSKIDCLVETFWAESSNIVGGDMIENVQAALSGDGGSKRGWRSANVIESVKATLSGDSSESKSGWRSVDMIGNIKASLSGESSERGWRSSDVIQSIKAAFSGDSESKGGSWSLDTPNGNVQVAPIDKGRNESKDLSEGLQSSVAVVETFNAADALGNGTLHEC